MIGFRSRRTLQLLAALLLVLSQALLHAHEADVDAHAGDESCEICISHHQLSHAGQSAPAGVPLPAQGRVPLIANTSTFAGDRYCLTPPGRGPPGLVRS